MSPQTPKSQIRTRFRFHLFVVVVVARDILDGMLRKILARGPRASATRSFHSSAPARRIVATNPVKAQEVQSFGKYPIIEHEYDAIVV